MVTSGFVELEFGVSALEELSKDEEVQLVIKTPSISRLVSEAFIEKASDEYTVSESFTNIQLLTFKHKVVNRKI